MEKRRAKTFPRKGFLVIKRRFIRRNVIRGRATNFSSAPSRCSGSDNREFLTKIDDDGEVAALSTLKGAERCQLVLHVHHGRAGSIRDDGNSDAKDDVQLDADLDRRWLVPDTALRLACDAGLLVLKRMR